MVNIRKWIYDNCYTWGSTVYTWWVNRMNIFKSWKVITLVLCLDIIENQKVPTQGPLQMVYVHRCLVALNWTGFAWDSFDILASASLKYFFPLRNINSTWEYFPNFLNNQACLSICGVPKLDRKESVRFVLCQIISMVCIHFSFVTHSLIQRKQFLFLLPIVIAFKGLQSSISSPLIVGEIEMERYNDG